VQDRPERNGSGCFGHSCMLKARNALHRSIRRLIPQVAPRLPPPTRAVSSEDEPRSPYTWSYRFPGNRGSSSSVRRARRGPSAFRGPGVGSGPQRDIKRPRGVSRHLAARIRPHREIKPSGADACHVMARRNPASSRARPARLRSHRGADHAGTLPIPKPIAVHLGTRPPRPRSARQNALRPPESRNPAENSDCRPHGRCAKRSPKRAKCHAHCGFGSPQNRASGTCPTRS
jgi:hypothetical protein